MTRKEALEYLKHRFMETGSPLNPSWESLEEQGRLLVLPCKVGDTVYENNGGRCQSDK